MKKKVLLSSIATIALCLCLIAGSTFALFTDSSRLDIEVTAGDVAIDADIRGLELWSVTPDAEGTVVDELGGRYTYENQTEKGKDMFLNTGKAAFKDNVLTIDRITPGDKVSFNIECANTSDVSILMRYVIKLDPETTNELATGMVLNADGINYTAITSYTSVWVPVAVGDAMPSVPVELGLPVYAGDEYQAKTVNYVVLVEAVQGNAAISYDRPIVEVANAVSNADEFNAAIADPFLETIVFDADTAVTISGNVANKTIYANSNAVSFTVAAGAVLDNVTISGLEGDYATPAFTFKSGAAGELTVKDCVINEASGKEAILLGGHNELVLNIEDCVFNGGKYAMRSTGNVNCVNISNTVFENKSGWAILVNGTVLDTLSINNCEFTNCADGLAKAGVGGGGYEGTVTLKFEFVNNTVENCVGHDGKENKMLEVKYLEGSTVTIDGNTRDGATWVPGVDQGIVQK